MYKIAPDIVNDSFKKGNIIQPQEHAHLTKRNIKSAYHGSGTILYQRYYIGNPI